MKAFAALIASTALALSTAAQAAPPDTGESYQSDFTFVSTKTRAEVKAETIAALRRGDILTGELYPLDFASPLHGRMRAQVKAELASATSGGEILKAQ